MRKIICPDCLGKGFCYEKVEWNTYKKFCELCEGKGVIKPGEPVKRFNVKSLKE